MTFRLLLLDPAYERRSVSPLAAPMAVGGLATYLMQALGDRIEIQIEKDIGACLAAIERQAWDAIGFSHYIWNARLSLNLAAHAKSLSPRTVTILGGPNLPIDSEAQENFIRTTPQIDLFIEKEAELALLAVVQALIETDADVDAVKAMALPSVRSVLNGQFLTSALADRLRNLDDIPSPYLSGMMDRFLDGGYTPMVENNRGCPFSCEFCGEGDIYHSKIAHHSLDRLFSEYDYIQKKMSSVDHPMAGYFYFSDSNTGMYKNDRELSKYLGDMRRRTGWPKRVITSTGKNRKELVLECIDALDGALVLTASVQSTNEDVLKNIKRSNISTDVLMAVSGGRGENSKSFSEIILALPGDSYEYHLKSIQDMIECEINELAVIQLMVLGDTPMAAASYREKYGLLVKKRILVKGIARQTICGHSKVIAEIEEICVGTNNMSFADYLRSRYADLVVTIFYNNIISSATHAAFKKAGSSVFHWVEELIARPKPENLANIFANFLSDTEAELFETDNEIDAFLQQPGIFEKIVNREMMRALIPYYADLAWRQSDDLIQLARAAAETIGGPGLAMAIDRDFKESAQYRSIYEGR